MAVYLPTQRSASSPKKGSATFGVQAFVWIFRICCLACSNQAIQQVYIGMKGYIFELPIFF